MNVTYPWRNMSSVPRRILRDKGCGRGGTPGAVAPWEEGRWGGPGPSSHTHTHTLSWVFNITYEEREEDLMYARVAFTSTSPPGNFRRKHHHRHQEALKEQVPTLRCTHRESTYRNVLTRGTPTEDTLTENTLMVKTVIR